ncbi:hypothetical protein AB6802_04880 [Mesorhizobium sp. RCC_202]|uniref:hypothetical protein n=1 Tax=Mesorhizobium sp. RCC_202 TaxID=3239222 RepID=UPI00352439B0
MDLSPITDYLSRTLQLATDIAQKFYGSSDWRRSLYGVHRNGGSWAPYFCDDSDDLPKRPIDRGLHERMKDRLERGHGDSRAQSRSFRKQIDEWDAAFWPYWKALSPARVGAKRNGLAPVHSRSDVLDHLDNGLKTLGFSREQARTDPGIWLKLIDKSIDETGQKGQKRKFLRFGKVLIHAFEKYTDEVTEKASQRFPVLTKAASILMSRAEHFEVPSAVNTCRELLIRIQRDYDDIAVPIRLLTQQGNRGPSLASLQVLATERRGIKSSIPGMNPLCGGAQLNAAHALLRNGCEWGTRVGISETESACVKDLLQEATDVAEQSGDFESAALNARSLALGIARNGGDTTSAFRVLDDARRNLVLEGVDAPLMTVKLLEAEAGVFLSGPNHSDKNVEAAADCLRRAAKIARSKPLFMDNLADCYESEIGLLNERRTAAALLAQH